MGGNTVEELTALIGSLEKIENEQHSLIQHIAKVQMGLQGPGKASLAEKLGQVFSNASKNTDYLHEMETGYPTA